MTRSFVLDAATRFVAAAFCLGIALLVGATAKAQDLSDLDPENTLIITVGLFYEDDADSAEAPQTGKVVIKLLPDVAPQHVARIKELTREGFYDGVRFHRVIEGFMAQTGDPTATGMGGSDKPDLPAEFSDVPFERGTLGMARAASPNSANSQFFICFSRADFLDGQYTVFGQVVEGMEHVDLIKRGPREQNGVVQGARDRMVTVRVMADVEG